jgi:hypothetical protein
MAFAQTFDTDIIQLLAGQQVTIGISLSGAAGFSAVTPVVFSLLAGTGAPTRVVTGFTGQTTVCSTSQTLTPGAAAVTLTATGVVPSTTRQLELRIGWTTAGTAAASDTLNVSLPRLNLGPVDLGPDLTRIYTTELPICQRFYQKSFPSVIAPGNTNPGVAPVVTLSTGASGGFGIHIPLRPFMRASPSVTTYNPSAANANWRDTTNAADRTATAGQITDPSFYISGAGGIAGSTNNIHWTADAEIM